MSYGLNIEMHKQGSSHLPQQLKFTTSDSCDRIKDEFQLLQAQYHRHQDSLPCTGQRYRYRTPHCIPSITRLRGGPKASAEGREGGGSAGPSPGRGGEKGPGEYYEMSYGLNIEMHKQAEIVKRLNGICAQVLPYLSQEHQQQVLGAIERAKQVTAPELNSIIRAGIAKRPGAICTQMAPAPLGTLMATKEDLDGDNRALDHQALGRSILLDHVPAVD
ncbi:amino-terminal enhancer of split-like protein [Amazona aestiva]|uniref:Amino-terminal enhancer of split-like protein n=1 Tax=Amazona aestiva TaxID=12930 RepID=A0A0Q3TPS5_AMAAE|nr:amino-terminal enhancer of split-like protein [Amazona aestiva]